MPSKNDLDNVIEIIKLSIDILNNHTYDQISCIEAQEDLEINVIGKLEDALHYLHVPNIVKCAREEGDSSLVSRPTKLPSPFKLLEEKNKSNERETIFIPKVSNRALGKGGFRVHMAPYRKPRSTKSCPR